ncbi:hypothetical protein MPH_03701 [Macrophomina phaseolina MS6]|uniref:Uncharacterized protein n=1 Tax=Macrophomina phaseolina (strain MS6) TaxID=1126212 RepID=K2R966_MACPH|nr:hypothetical protein MPH_03701 [Macrophomina phaseolina MS6]
MACVVPPANTPHVSYKVAAGKSWPRGNTMHSRNSSMSSTTSANASTPSNLSIVPELSPSKSESHFDTTSTRAAVNFAAAEISANENNENTTSDKSKERSLYGPLEIDASCFSFSSSNYSQTLDVAWTTTSKDNPLLFNNVLAKANAVFSGDYNAMFEHAVHEPSATELRAHERKRRQLQLRREQQEREWEELVGCALHFDVDLRAAKELWRCNDRVAAKELLQQQVAVAFAEWRSQQNAGRLDFVKTPPGLPSKGGGVAAAAERAVVAFPPPSVKQSQDVFHNSGNALPAAPEEEDKDGAWETCENSPVSTSPVDASSMDKSGGGVEDSTTQASQEEALCSSAVKAGNNASTDMPMLSSKPVALSLRSGHSSNRELEHGEAEENDACGDCAIESCSFISRPHIRRYY